MAAWPSERIAVAPGERDRQRGATAQAPWPMGGLTGFQARARLTPRRRSARYRRRPHDFQRSPRCRRRILGSSALTLNGASAKPT